MIGIEWLEANNAFWMFKRGAIRINGRTYKLSERKQRDVWVQRVTLVRATTVCKLDALIEQDEDEEMEDEEVEEETVAASESIELETLQSKDCWTDEEMVPVVAKENTVAEGILPDECNDWAHACLQHAQQTDESLSVVYRALETSSSKPSRQERSEWPALAKILGKQWDRLRLQDGILHSQWKNTDGRSFSYPVVMPEKYRQGEFWKRHVDESGKHRTCAEMLRVMESEVYWPGRGNDIYAWIKECQHCSEFKSRQERPSKSPGPLALRRSVAVQTPYLWFSAMATETYPPFGGDLVPTMTLHRRTFRLKMPETEIRLTEKDECIWRDRRRQKRPARFRE